MSVVSTTLFQNKVQFMRLDKLQFKETQSRGFDRTQLRSAGKQKNNNNYRAMNGTINSINNKA